MLWKQKYCFVHLIFVLTLRLGCVHSLLRWPTGPQLNTSLVFLPDLHFVGVFAVGWLAFL